MVVRRLLATAVTVPLLLVAECNGDEPTPQMPTTPATSSSTSTPTPTVDPLAVPVEATKPTKAGAEALIRHFWDMVNHLIETGNAQPARRLFGPGCDYCTAGLDFYESALQQGASFEGGNEHPTRIRLSLLASESGIPAAYAVVTTTASAQVQRDPEGKVAVRIPGGSTKKDYFLEFQDGSWLIANVEDPK